MYEVRTTIECVALRCQALKKDAGQTQTHRQCLVVLHRDS